MQMFVFANKSRFIFLHHDLYFLVAKQQMHIMDLDYFGISRYEKKIHTLPVIILWPVITYIVNYLQTG
jgi:hypothetical protein